MCDVRTASDLYTEPDEGLKRERSEPILRHGREILKRLGYDLPERDVFGLYNSLMSTMGAGQLGKVWNQEDVNQLAIELHNAELALKRAQKGYEQYTTECMKGLDEYIQKRIGVASRKAV